MTEYLDVDVRPILRAGGEPFSTIMAAVESIQPGQGIRLYAPFKPVPLFDVMAGKGFAHSATEIGGGDWQVLFTPTGKPAEALAARTQPSAKWPDSKLQLDTRELDPPEPMTKILAAAETLGSGETLTAFLSREPVFLFPQLEKRGYNWLGGFLPDGVTYELTVRAPSR